MTDMRQDLLVRLDGVQGNLSISAEERDDGDTLIWVSIDGPGDATISVGVDPKDLRDAISFVLADAMTGSDGRG